MNVSRVLKLSAIIIALFLIDIYSKKFIFSWLTHISGAEKNVDYLIYPIIGSKFGLNLVIMYNKGVSFSLFSGLPAARMIITIVCSIIVIFLIKELLESNDKFKTCALTLIISGAVGNLYDRIFIGAVRDFIDIYIASHHWPAFNIADSMVCLGGTIYIYNQIFNRKSKKVK